MVDSPSSFVTTIDLKLAPKLQHDLGEQGFNLTQPAHTHFSAKKPGLTCTLYLSGKLVVQGKECAHFVEFYLEPEILQSFTFAYPTSNLDLTPRIGIDESGKGDFFGPLVIAGVMVDEKNRVLFEELGIKDSKTLKDEQMLKMALQIQKHSVYSVVAISNAKYNELYAKFKNLNKLLAWGHAKVIENILEKEPCEYALSDKFGDESLIKNALQKHGQKITLEQRTKAESDIAVAAASVLARATFVQKMKTMENTYKCKFPKGCNDIVKTCAREFIRIYGQERLNEVCKTHFKTYNELL